MIDKSSNLLCLLIEFVLSFAQIFIAPNPWDARYDLYCEEEYKEMAQVGPISNGWHDPRE